MAMGTSEGVGFLRHSVGSCLSPSIISVSWPSEAMEDRKLFGNIRLTAPEVLGIPGYGHSQHGLEKVVETLNY